MDSIHITNRNCFFSKRFGYVEPCSYQLGSTDHCTSRGRIVTVHRCGYYVPLKEQLHALLSMHVVQSVFSSENSSEYIYDFCDAQYLQQHQLQSSRSTLNLCLYTDDFEIVNPIAVHGKKPEITAFYWTLLNIPSEYRSKLSDTTCCTRQDGRYSEIWC